MNKVLLLYTMTSGLGDYIVMGDLMHKVETLIPGAKCLMAHRGNPHVNLWPYDNPLDRFFDVYRPHQLLKLIAKLRRAQKERYTVFGLQMAPGSIQGFFFHWFLKRLKALDFIVDFNLINADVITPPRGDYILDLHLNQVSDLLRVRVPSEFYRLNLPVQNIEQYNKSVHDKKADGELLVGIHPWSRRGNLSCFVWPFAKWLETIKFLLGNDMVRVVVFGKDFRFSEFRDFVKNGLEGNTERIGFVPCSSVIELIGVMERLDIILTVNTAVVHIGYALEKKMIVLCGPSLDLWIPKHKEIKCISDKESILDGADKFNPDNRFPSIERISYDRLLEELLEFVGL